jgi:hypothetical protein
VVVTSEDIILLANHSEISVNVVEHHEVTGNLTTIPINNPAKIPTAKLNTKSLLMLKETGRDI